MMKNSFFLLLLLLTSQFTLAQSIDECRRLVKLTIESINNKSSENLNELLADDFIIAGQKGDMAKLVLNQLLSQLKDTVQSYEEKSQNKLDTELELKYNIRYEKMGIKEVTFLFNERNLLKEIDLLTMKVKKMSNKSELIKSSKSTIEIPFKMVGSLIAVDVMLNGTLRKFIFDTGAPKVILNSRYTIRDSTLTSISSAKGISGNISGMNIEKVVSLDFNGVQLNNQEVLTMNLAHLEEVLEHRFYGLIGYDLIKDYDIIFDYKRHTITLINPDTFDNYKNKNLSNSKLQKVPFKLERHIPIIEAKLNDNILKFGIDCGAVSNLIDDDLFPVLKKYLRKVRTIDLIGADGNRNKVKEGEIKKMTIGNRSFKNVKTSFSDISHLNKTFNLSHDGLIGYPILHKQKTLISFRRKELIFIE